MVERERWRQLETTWTHEWEIRRSCLKHNKKVFDQRMLRRQIDDFLNSASLKKKTKLDARATDDVG